MSRERSRAAPLQHVLAGGVGFGHAVSHLPMRGQMSRAQIGWLVVAATLSLCAPAFAALPQPGNPSAETPSSADPTSPEAWQVESWGNVIVDHAWTTIDAYDGNRALRVSMSKAAVEGDVRWISAPIDVSALAGGKVGVRHGYRASAIAHVWAHASNTDGSKTAWLSLGPTKAGTAWAEHAANLDLPTWATSLRLCHVLATIGWLETDAWQIVEPLSAPGDPPVDPPGDPTPTGPTDPPLSTASPKAGNVLPNPSFETASAVDGSTPAYWAFSTWGAASTAATGSWVVGGALQGNRALHLTQISTPADGDGKWLSVPVPVHDFNALLRLTCSYRGSTGLTLLLHASNADGSTTQWFAVASGPTWPTWRLLSGTLTLPDWTASVRVGARIDGVGTVDLDLCSLAAAAPPAPLQPQTLGSKSVLANGSFEAAHPWDPALPAAWSAEIWGDVDGKAAWLNDGFDGARSVRLEVGTKGTGEGEARWQSERVLLAAPGWVELRDRVRGTAPSVMRLLVRSADGAKQQWLSSPVIAASPSQWTQASFVVELPEWTSTVQVSHGIASAGRLDLDAVELVLPQSTPNGPDDPGPDGGPTDPTPAVASVGASNCVPNANLVVLSKVAPALPWWWGGSATGALSATVSRISTDDGGFALRLIATGSGDGTASAGTRHFPIAKRATWAQLSATLRGQGAAELYVVARDELETVTWRHVGRVELTATPKLASGLAFIPAAATSLQVLAVLRSAGSVELSSVALVESAGPPTPSGGDNTTVAGFNVGPVGPARTDHGSEISGCSAGRRPAAAPGAWLGGIALLALLLIARRRPAAPAADRS